MDVKPESNPQESPDRLINENAFLRAALEKTDQGRELIRQWEEFSLLLSVSKLIVSELSLDRVFQLVAGKARDLVQADMLLVPMLNEQRDKYTYVAAVGEGAEAVLKASLPVTVGMCGWVLQHEQSLLFGEASPCWLDEMTAWEQGQQSAVLVPLFGKKQIIGGLSALGKQGGGSFTPHDLDLLTMFANQVSTAIENATLFQQVLREIEERKQAEDALRASENRLQLATSAGKIGVWDWDIGKNILIWDESMYSLYGMRKEEFGGAYEAWTGTLHPEDRQFVEGEIQAALRNEREYAPEFRIVRSDGTVRNIKAESRIIRDPDGSALRMIGTNMDITERKQAQQALQQSEEFIKNILEVVDQGFIVIDRDYRILSANSAYAKMVALPLEKIIGRNCYEVSHHVHAPCFSGGHPCAVQEVFTTRTSQERLHVHQSASGGSIHIETKAYPLMKDASGEVVTAIETLVDVTERKRLEDQFHQSQKMESIGTLAGGIAHDFNNILTAIIGYGNLALLKMAKDDPQRLNIEHMLEAGARAAHLTKDLLLFSRKQISERKPVDMNEIIRKMSKFLVRVIGEDVECRTTLHSEQMAVLGDAHQLEQVLMNLATNARDAMPEGGVFSLATEPVRFNDEFISVHGYGKPGNYVLTTISDTGKGIHEDTREHIFEPFFTTKEVGKGSGLGLAVVYGIVKQHEGFLNVYSEPGQGTTFKIYLPLITARVDKEVKPVEELPRGGTETILLAEDDETVRILTRTVLEDMGYHVITAIDGQDAVDKYAANKDTIRLLLFDIVMPKKTGKEAYEEIRAMKPGVKVLFASGYAPDLVRQKLLLEDSAPVVFKPIAPTELLKMIRKILDRQ